MIVKEAEFEIGENKYLITISTNDKEVHNPAIFTDNKEMDEINRKALEEYRKLVLNTYDKLAQEVIDGKYGNGNNRKKKLQSLGYDYDFCQCIVNAMLGR